MSCTFDKEQLNLYVDGMLPDGEAEQVRKHVSACPECRKEVEALELIGRAFRGLPREKASPELIEKVFARTLESAQQSWRIVTKRTLRIIARTFKNKFEIEDELAASLRGELPAWGLRWVLFV